VEIICDFIHVTPEMIKLVFKIKNPEDILLISDSIISSRFEKRKIQAWNSQCNN